METVYKVCLKEKGKCYSIMYGLVNHVFELEYQIGERTYPKIGKVLSFRTEEHAIDFHNRYVSRFYTIFRCEAEGVIEMKEVSKFTGTMRSFWEGGTSTTSAPEGTVGCDWVKPIEEVR